MHPFDYGGPCRVRGAECFYLRDDREHCVKNNVKERRGVGGWRNGDKHRVIEGFSNTRARRV